MKVLYLNCWHGKIKKKLLNFIKEKSNSVDVFCLQEVPPILQGELERILTNFKPIYRYILVKNNFTDFYGQSIFIKRNIQIKNSELTEMFKNRKPNYGFLQIVDILYKGKNISISNMHGRSQPGHKLDTKTRIIQSQTIIDAFSNKKGLKIVGGDFNLEPDTKIIKIIEDSGLLNLIKNFRIKTTRNNLAWKISKNNGKKGILKYYKKQLFADYCFVNEDVKVRSFKIPNIEVSDHLPLILEFEL